jgi:tetratricopeptide (TPR) repeat protein
MKSEEGKGLQVALSRLSVFIAYFVDFTAAPVLENRMPEDDEDLEKILPAVKKNLHDLWKCGLIERITIASEEEHVSFYRLHPTLSIFAKEHLADAEIVHENYRQSLGSLSVIAQDEFGKNPLWVQIVARALPDLLAASMSKTDKDASFFQFNVSKFLYQFGLYDDSLRLLEKALTINESLNNLNGKAAVLGEVARIHATRGDLSEAMKLLQQALEIFDTLNDPKGKSAALHEIARIAETLGKLDYAIKMFQQALEIREEIGDLRGKSSILHEMAATYGRRGELDKAISFYQQASVGTDRLGKAKSIAGIASILMARGDLDEARKMYEQALEVTEGLGDQLSVAVILSNLGQLDSLQKKYRDSLEKLLSAMEITVKLQANLDSEYIAKNIFSSSRKRKTRLKLNDISHAPQSFNRTTEQERQAA